MPCRDLDELFELTSDRVGALPGVDSADVSPIHRQVKQASTLGAGKPPGGTTKGPPPLAAPRVRCCTSAVPRCCYETTGASINPAGCEAQHAFKSARLGRRRSWSPVAWTALPTESGFG